MRPTISRSSYNTTYIGSMQELVKKIWNHTPNCMSSVLDAFSGSVVMVNIFEAMGFEVEGNDRLRFWH